MLMPYACRCLLFLALSTHSGCRLPMSNPIRPPAPFAAVGPGALIIAHRGGSLEAPENTLAAIRQATQLGSDWQEVDVTLSADGVPVVFHDDELGRTTEGQGAVEQLPLAALKQLHAGRPHPNAGTLGELQRQQLVAPDFAAAYADERIPTLEEVLRVPQARLMLELKQTKRVIDLARATVQAVHRTQMTGRVAIASFDVRLLEAVYGLDPALPLVGIVENSLTELDHLLDLPLMALAVDKNLLKEVLGRAPPGVAVWAWTAYSAQEAEVLAAAGAHGVITDAPRATAAVLRPQPDRLSLWPDPKPVH